MTAITLEWLPIGTFFCLCRRRPMSIQKHSSSSKELVALSREATGTKHPGPLSLAQVDGMVTAAAVSKDDQDHWIFSAPVKLASGDEIPMALVVKGRAQQ
jgi:hypothetical protein